MVVGASPLEDKAGGAGVVVLNRLVISREVEGPAFGAKIVPLQNHSLLYAIHQLAKSMGNVAPSAHQIGRVKSATNPSKVNVIQKTFFSILIF